MERDIETEESHSTTPACVERENQTSPIRIWLVDDNDGFRELLATVFASEDGFECSRQFPSPVGALAALASEAPPDVVLLDVQMGRYNGLDAIGPIKALAPSTHVLMLTTFASPECRARAFREGASDFMLKSWEFSEMAAHVRRAMEFGSAAGLLTAFLSRETPPERAENQAGDEQCPGNGRGSQKFNLKNVLSLLF